MNPASLLERLRPRAGSYSGEVVQTLLTSATLSGVTLASGVLLARWLGPEGRGELAAIQALPLIIGSLGMLGLQDSIIYFGARDRERAGLYAVSSTALLALLVIPIVLLAAWFTPIYLRDHRPEIIRAGQIYLAVCFVNVFMGLPIFVTRAVHDITLWNKLRLLPAALWVAVILGAIALGRVEAAPLSYVYLATLFPLGALMFWPVRRHLRGRWRVDRALWPRLLRYGLPLAAGASPQIVNERVDQLIVIGALSSEQVGFYAVAVSWSMLVRLSGEALISVAFSKIAGIAEPVEQRRFIRLACWAVVAVSAAVAALLLATARPVIPRVFGGEFAPAVVVSMILVLAAALRNVARMLQTCMQSVGRPGAVMLSEWAGLAVLAAALGILLPRFGLTGAAWAGVLAGAASTATALIVFSRWMKKP